jgi:hypothetical protein
MTNIAPVPLLWLVPLEIYLASFVIAFASESAGLLRGAGWMQPLVLLVTGALLILGEHAPWSLPVQVATFAACAYLAHASSRTSVRTPRGSLRSTSV